MTDTHAVYMALQVVARTINFPSCNIMSLNSSPKSRRGVWNYRPAPPVASNSLLLFCFQDLNVNFRSIILPESLKALQCGDSSMEVVLAELDRIVETGGRGLDTLLGQLETQLRNTIMDLPVWDKSPAGLALDNPNTVRVCIL